MQEGARRGLARLMLRWPDRRSQLERASERASIADLYSAYDMACSAVEHWSHSNEPNAEDRLNEYRALVSATEKDILELLP